MIKKHHYSELEQGDIIYVDLNPIKGQEQRGRRPCIVLTQSNPYLNYMVGVAPITSTNSTFPLHVELPKSLSTSGKVLLDQHRMIDIETHGFSYREKAPKEFVRQCTQMIKLLYDL